MSQWADYLFAESLYPQLDHVHHDTPGSGILSKIAHPARGVRHKLRKPGDLHFLKTRGKVRNKSQPGARVSNVDQLFTRALGDDDDD
jgi:hypothetical protein